MSDDEDPEQYIKRVREDHAVHRLAHIVLSIWAGQAWGWLWGVAVFFGLFVAIALSNLVIAFTTESFRAMNIARWLWLLALLVTIIATTATIE